MKSEYQTYAKPRPEEMGVRPNIADYDRARMELDWKDIEPELDGLPGGGLNMAHEAIDRHCLTDRKDKVAMYWESEHGESERYTFQDLQKLTNKFANVLSTLGVRKGDRVFVLMSRVPELYAAVFGTLKIGAIFGPLFSAFGPDAIRDRLQDSDAKVLVTSHQFMDTVHEIRGELPELKHVLVVDRQGSYQGKLQPGEVSYEAEMDKASDIFTIASTSPEDYAVMHYTSGTTGKPKGALLVHGAILGQYATSKWALDLHDDDIYWCTADPGWVTGTSYGMFGPWSNGVSQVIYEGEFRPGSWYKVIEEYKITVWYTAPTAVRALMKVGERAIEQHDLSSLRHICSVGEPLNPEAVAWANKVFNMPIHDTWWQTETGCILITNYPALDIRAGSMGKPIPGITAAVIDEEGNEKNPGEEGNLALKPGWPSMFRAYWKKEEMYQSKFQKGWYMTGDRAFKDEDGYFWFVGRADDVINTAGHLVGPFEVESVLMEHPAVAEAGVIGKPDEARMEVVKAFVVLKEGYEATKELKKDIGAMAKKRLLALSCPRDIEFTSSLPKTRSGKIMRRVLKARELGLPEGDLSTLEAD
jgi:acetyl-CoA synthetase